MATNSFQMTGMSHALYASSQPIDWSKLFNEVCARGDEKATLEFLQTNHATLLENKVFKDPRICFEPIDRDMKEVVAYLHQQHVHLSSNSCARVQSVEMLMLLRSFRCPWDRTLFHAISSDYPKPMDSRDVEAIIKFARSDPLDPCPWDSSAYACAFVYERPDIVKLLHSYGCPWDNATALNAFKEGQVEALRFLLEHGAPWPCNATNRTSKNWDVHGELVAIIKPYTDRAETNWCASSAPANQC